MDSPSEDLSRLLYSIVTQHLIILGVDEVKYFWMCRGFVSIRVLVRIMLAYRLYYAAN